MPELYKLENDAKRAELGGPPFIFGSALRVPSYAYGKWNIYGDDRHLTQLSRMVYQDEFVDTSPSWMESVIEAAKRGGIGDRPNLLRKGVADIAAKLTVEKLRKHRKIHVLDIGSGAGGSTTAYLDALKQIDKDAICYIDLTCIDLSRQSLWTLIDNLAKYEFFPNENLKVIHSRDIEIPMHVSPGSQDIVINVAGIHANAYLDPAMNAISHILDNSGHFVSGDWHHARWEHPYHTYKLLDETDPGKFEWQNKGAFMDEFAGKFSKSREKPDLSGLTPEELAAIDEIGRYWRDGWATVRYEKIKAGALKPMDEQIVAEGHRPVKHYETSGSLYRLEKDTKIVVDGIMRQNPQRVVEGTDLNMLLVLQKSE